MFKTLKDKFNKLGQAFSLHRLSDKNLLNVSRLSKISATLAAGHASIWVGIGVIGVAALGLHAAGIAIPAFIGVGTICLGGLLGLKSVVVNRVCTAMHKHCDGLLRKRGVKPAPAPAPAPTPAAEATVGVTPPLANSFAPAASNSPLPPPAAPAPEIKPPAPTQP